MGYFDDEGNWVELPEQDNTYGDFPPLGTPDQGAGQGSWQDPVDPAIAQGGGGGQQPGGWMQKLVGAGKGQGFADLGSVLGKFSEGEKSNRAMKGHFTQNYDQLMMEAEKGRNSTESDALKKLAVTKYLMEGGAKPGASSLNINGHSMAIPASGFAPTPASEAQKAGAATLQAQLLKRLTEGGTYKPQDLSSYADPTMAEKIGSYGAAASGGLGTINTMMDGQPHLPQRPAPQGPSTASRVLGGVQQGVGAVNTGKQIYDMGSNFGLW